MLIIFIIFAIIEIGSILAEYTGRKKISGEEKEEIINKKIIFNNNKALASAILGDELYQKAFLGNDLGQALEWKVAGNDSKHVVLFGCIIFDKPYKDSKREENYKARLFDNDEQVFIESTFESVNVFNKDKEYKHIVIGADANDDIYNLPATENLKYKVANHQKKLLEKAVEEEFYRRMRARGSFVSSKAYTSQPLMRMIRKEKAHYYENKTVFPTKDNRAVIVINRDAFMKSDYCKALKE